MAVIDVKRKVTLSFTTGKIVMNIDVGPLLNAMMDRSHQLNLAHHTLLEQTSAVKVARLVSFQITGQIIGAISVLPVAKNKNFIHARL